MFFVLALFVQDLICMEAALSFDGDFFLAFLIVAASSLIVVVPVPKVVMEVCTGPKERAQQRTVEPAIRCKRSSCDQGRTMGVVAIVDSEGNMIYDLRPLMYAYGWTLVNYCALFYLHECVLRVCAANFSITENTLAEWVKDSAYWSAFLATARWRLFAVLGFAISAFSNVLGLKVKFALESVDLLIFVTDFEVESAKFNMCPGHREVRKLPMVTTEGKRYHTSCLLWLDQAIVQFKLWKLIGSDQVSETTDLTIVDVVDSNFVHVFLVQVHGSRVEWEPEEEQI